METRSISFDKETMDDVTGYNERSQKSEEVKPCSVITRDRRFHPRSLVRLLKEIERIFFRR